MTDTGSGMLRVELDLVPDAEPIQGRARGADGVGHAFAGWLELVEFLDRARINRPPRSSTDPTATQGESR
ncbi:MAG TPA: hypothetical protein VF106_27160 [Actinophytocola sp.]